MTRLLSAVAAIALIVPVAATAQSQNDRQHGNRNQHGQNRQAAPQNNGPRGNEQHAHNQGSRGHEQRGQGHGAQGNEQRGQGHAHRGNEQRIENQGMANRHGHEMNHGHSYRNNRANQEVYHPGHRPSSFHRYHAGGFHYPHGYHYRRWNVGSVLPRLLLSDAYFWGNWGALGLGAPPPGYVWVRYGPDLLLVNRYTGRIADVIYGAFY